jgi:hypothetical protein
MEKSDAEQKADYWMELMIKHQPQLFSALSATGPHGQQIGLALAEMRKTLSEELQKQ